MGGAVPRYFFDFNRNDELTIDQDGHEFMDAATAHKEGMRALGEMAGDEIKRCENLRLILSIADERHRIVVMSHVRFEAGKPVVVTPVKA